MTVAELIEAVRPQSPQVRLARAQAAVVRAKAKLKAAYDHAEALDDEIARRTGRARFPGMTQ